MSDDPELSRPDPAMGGRSRDNSAAGVSDPLGVAAIVLGCVGIVVAGIVLCVVIAILAAEVGRRRRDAGLSMENAYIAFVLAAVDGIVWIALHVLFDIPFIIG